jgi:hypothetical protein
MTVPHIVRIGGLVIATTAFYGYVGQMVPQKEVQPPQETILRADLTTADSKTGALRFPDLEGVAERAKTRVPGLSDVEYFAQSMYEPNAFIVPGFNPGMPAINKPPIGLTDQEILCVMAYLQSLGGTPTVTLQTTHRYLAAPATPGATPAAAPASGAPAGGTTAPAAPKKGDGATR